MLNNRECARAFAEGRRSGNSAHMYIDGDRIYSYGRHLCIARRYEGRYLVATRWWSVTTAKHVLLVMRALPSDGYVFCYDPDASVEANMKHYAERIAELEKKASSARTRGAYYNRVLAEVRSARDAYSDLMESYNKYKTKFDC